MDINGNLLTSLSSCPLVPDSTMEGSAKAFYSDVFAKQGALFDELKVTANNGMEEEIKVDLLKQYETRPGLAMPNVMWNKDVKLKEVKCVIPDRSHDGVYDASVKNCQEKRQCSVKDDANKKAFEKNITKETKMEMIKNSLISGDSSKANSSLPKVKQLSALHYDRRYDNDNEDDEDNDNDDDNVFRYERGLDSFSVGHILGEGMFGTVFLGSASNIYGPQTTKVVVKQVKDVLKADDSQMDAVIAEMKIMSNLNMHPNLVNLLGACTSELCYNKISLLLEFCPYGDLKQFLVEHRGQFESCLRSEPGKLSLSCHTSCHTSCHRPPGEPVQLAPAAPVESRHRQGPGLPHLHLHHARRPRRQERPDRGELRGKDQ